MQIFVCNSQATKEREAVINDLRGLDYTVYDPQDDSMDWAALDPAWERWPVGEYLTGLQNSLTTERFYAQSARLTGADLVILIAPGEVESYMQAGIAIALNKPVIVYIPGEYDPNLWHYSCHEMTDSRFVLLQMVSFYATAKTIATAILN